MPFYSTNRYSGSVVCNNEDINHSSRLLSTRNEILNHSRSRPSWNLVEMLPGWWTSNRNVCRTEIIIGSLNCYNFFNESRSDISSWCVKLLLSSLRHTFCRNKFQVKALSFCKLDLPHITKQFPFPLIFSNPFVFNRIFKAQTHSFFPIQRGAFENRKLLEFVAWSSSS